VDANSEGQSREPLLKGDGSLNYHVADSLFRYLAKVADPSLSASAGLCCSGTAPILELGGSRKGLKTHENKPHRSRVPVLGGDTLILSTKSESSAVQHQKLR
jgi:hypothetical protein